MNPKDIWHRYAYVCMCVCLGSCSKWCQSFPSFLVSSCPFLMHIQAVESGNFSQGFSVFLPLEKVLWKHRVSIHLAFSSSLDSFCSS